MEARQDGGNGVGHSVDATPASGPRAIPEAIASRAGPGDVVRVGAGMLSVRHWDRLLGGALYAATPRLDWARLLQRSLDVDVLKCPNCDGRLRIVAAVTDRASVTRILAHLGVPTDAPVVARARDPTEDEGGAAQLELDLG